MNFPVRSWWRWRLALTLAGLLVIDSRAADYIVANWGSEEGLPHSIVNSIVQTRDGYLWLGTYVGLVRFDGVRFVQYSSFDMPELGVGRVWKLFEDREGTLWIALESGGLVALKDGVPRVYLADRPPNGSTITAMAEDASGTLWLQTSDSQLGRVTNQGIQFVAKGKPVRSRTSLGLVVDGQDNLWVGTSDGPKLWRQGGWVTTPGLASLAGAPLDALAAARDGSLWVCRDRHLWKLHPEGIVAEIEAPSQLTSKVTQMIETSDRSVWLGAEDGNLFYLTPDGQWQTVPSQAGLSGFNRVLYQDREDNLWRGSDGGGLGRLRPRLFSTHGLAQPPDFDRYAMSLSSDAEGNVWGVFNNHSDHALARILSGSATPEPWPASGISPSIRIRALFSDRRNRVWAGTDEGCLFCLRDNIFVPKLQLGDGSEYISALFGDAQSNLWVGFSQGIAVLPQGDPAQWHSLSGVPFPDVRSIAQSADGAMWFGTHYGGVCRWKDGAWTRFTTRDGLPSDYVRCLHADPDGTIWLGTIHGLCRWRNGQFTAIKHENGLWNDSISHIDTDERGNLWMSSFRGVFRVHRRELNGFADGFQRFIQCVGYNRNDGLPALECPGSFQPAGAKTPDGRLWFPTLAGVVSIAPGSIPQNRLPPPIWVEEVQVDGERRTVSHSTKQFKVGPGKRRIEFRFTALSLVAPEKVRFRHQLAGLDPDWSDPDDSRVAAYSYIPPGNYTFQVNACNNDGVWNPTGISLQLLVQPFFWQTWWFKFGVGLLVALGLAAGVRQFDQWKSRQRLARLEQQHALERERARIAKDIHDDLGASLAQIALLSERMDASPSNPAEVESASRRVAAIAQRSIQSLDEIVWAVTPKYDTLESLANYLSQFVQEHLALASVRCILEVPTVLPPLGLLAEVRHNLLLAAREAVQNVVAHAAATEVQLSLQLDPAALTIVVADNGHGFRPDQVAGEGNGLENMRRRLAEIGGQLEMASTPGRGTVVRFTVPRDRLSH